MKRMLAVCAFLLSITLSCPHRAAAGDAGHDPPPSASDHIDLPVDLHRVLSGEMVYLQKGMMTLIPAITGANWEQVAKTATRIRDSYIMEKQLSEKQMKTLHQRLPPLFQEWDRSFHLHAEKMAQAAEKGNAEVVLYYFHKLNEACVACHARYAAEKFPGFAAAEEHSDHR